MRQAIDIKHLDLRGVTRDADQFICTIQLDTGDYSVAGEGPMKRWIVCGRIGVRFPDGRGSRPIVLSARAHSATDFEHDSA